MAPNNAEGLRSGLSRAIMMCEMCGSVCVSELGSCVNDSGSALYLINML